MKRKPQILIVNDDGIHGPGLDPLADALKSVGEVTVVVPASERSADSHSLTLHKPLRVTEIRPRVFIVNGSPASCARLAILEVMRRGIDLVASGINRGYNLGQDVLYSGTVAGAKEATLLGLPAFAISRSARHANDSEPGAYAAAAVFAKKIAREILRNGLPPGICLNVNVPDRPAARIRGARIARLGHRIYDQKVTLRHDPAGRAYFWLMGREVSGHPTPGTDVAAVRDGYISVTPIQLDATHAPSLRLLARWKLA